MRRPTCVVVGLHQNGLGVARALGRQGVPVIGVDRPHGEPYSATKYARYVGCPDLKGPGLIDTLCDIGRSLDQRGVLILTLDRSVLLVSEHRARLEPYFSHSLPDDAVVKQLMDKSATESFARANGFTMPRTYSIRSEDDLERCIAEIAVPCILKPALKTVAFVEHSPKKAFFIKSIPELRDTWYRVSQWEPGIVIQEWIPGSDTQLVFSLFYFDEHGRPAASFGGRKIRQFIPHCGTACAAEPWHDDTVYAEGVRFFQRAGYRGFGAIEFKVGPDGRYYLIEPTVGRTEHIFAMAVANGVNLPLVGYCHMSGLSWPAFTSRRRVIYVDLRRDFRAAKVLIGEGSLTWGQWVRSIARPTQHGLFALDDPAPLAHHFRRRGERGLKATVSRVARALDRRRARVSVPDEELGAAVVPRQSPAAPDVHLNAAIDWLCGAHDAAGGGGVARGYAFSTRSGYAHGWQAAYPETTGYLIPTFFDCAAALKRPDLQHRALQMASWEIGLQLEGGGFPGGTIDRRPLPVVFNTGMVLLGLVRAFEETGASRFKDAAARAADFLVAAQSRDGAWRRFANMNGNTNFHAYDCLVTWGLVRSAQLWREQRWADAAVRNLQFTLSLQKSNGWFRHNALRPVYDRSPVTHTIAYATAGCLEAGIMLDAPLFVAAAERTARAVMEHLQSDGFLAGEFDSEWRPQGPWACLTGTAQMAIIWWRLYELRGDPRYADAARRATSYVLCRQELTRGGPATRGGIAGSFPVGARYGRYQFLNWAAKFLVDALLLEERCGTSSSRQTMVPDRAAAR